MISKLTLAIDENTVKKAKKYAYQRKVSLSKLVQFFFSSLTSEAEEKDIPISVITSELAGMVKSIDIKDKDVLAGALISKYL